MEDRTKQIGALVLSTTLLFSTGCISATKANSTSIEKYIVQKGDTLRGISRDFYSYSKYYDELASYNNLNNPDLIYTGQVLLIPELTALLRYCNDLDKDNSEEKIHEIKKGDTLSSICKKYYGTTEYLWKLATYNNLDNPNIIREGRNLKIPNLDILKNVVSRDYSDCFKPKPPEHHHDPHHMSYEEDDFDLEPIILKL